MMSAFILVIALATLLQFFISYCRSLISASAKQNLSVETLDVTGIKPAAPRGEDFARVMQLLQLCPERPNDSGEIRAVHGYYRLLGIVRASLARWMPSLHAWTETQRAQCAYFAAVALDRRITFSRAMLAAQINNSQ